MKSQPLTDAELDRLGAVLVRLGDKRSMNLEQLDGFLAALACGPDIILPSEYLPEILGDDIVLEDVSTDQPMLQEFIFLITRHWNAISDTLHFGDVIMPSLLPDENGITRANDWANGFLRGVELSKKDWASLLRDEKHGGSLVPIFALAHENNPDPAMRPYKEPISAERREDLIVHAIAGVTKIYRYFEAQRSLEGQSSGNATTFLRTTPKIGRNDPCPCGSGKKFKRCCSNTSLRKV
jgi:uncharacterized protein